MTGNSRPQDKSESSPLLETLTDDLLSPPSCHLSLVTRHCLLRSEQNLDDARLCGPLHRPDAVGEPVLFADQALDVHRLVFEQTKRGRETAAARADDADLVDDDARGVDGSRALKS